MTQHAYLRPHVERRSRRDFLRAVGITSATFALPSVAAAALRGAGSPIRLGLIADLHHDVMHDGLDRLESFLTTMQAAKPDAILQLGDFAIPSDENRSLIERFNQAHAEALHVIGNHDVDGGFSFEQVVETFGMKHRYYTHDVGGLRLIVLDGNEKPPNHQRGYPQYIGPEQMEWLRNELDSHPGPMVVFCHQPLAGPHSIDNAEEVQTHLNSAADRVVLAVNGHTHIDNLVRSGNVVHFHCNSASYYWVGGAHTHESYPPEIHEKYEYIKYTCPYRDPLFATLTFLPDTGEIRIEGRGSEWVGKSPAEVGRDGHPDLIDGEEIVPTIRSRRLARLAR